MEQLTELDLARQQTDKYTHKRMILGLLAFCLSFLQFSFILKLSALVYFVRGVKFANSFICLLT
jgi:hypothetical protein